MKHAWPMIPALAAIACSVHHIVNTGTWIGFNAALIVLNASMVFALVHSAIMKEAK